MSAVRDLTRAVRRHRALLTAGLVAAAVATALPTLAPTPVATRSVVAAAHDLAPGAALTAADLTELELPVTDLPHGVLTTSAAVIGRTLAGPVRQGEALTDVRLVGAGLLPRASALVAAPVRLADPAAAALLRAGDHVDVLATASQATAQTVATTIASNLQVLAVPVPDQADPDGALIVLAATPATAAQLAGAAVASRLSVTVLAS